jgi:hypothetical protein
LSRKVEVDNQEIKYRKLKGVILVNPQGVILNRDNINIAMPERAFLDMLYLNKNYYTDNVAAFLQGISDNAVISSTKKNLNFSKKTESRCIV